MKQIRIHLTISLRAETQAKLSRLARRAGVSDQAMASRLLAQAVDYADPDAATVVTVLDRIPGAWDRIEAGVADARAGRTISLDDL